MFQHCRGRSSVGHFFRIAIVLKNHYPPSYFTRSLYKQMLGQRVHPSDVEALDPDFYKQIL